MDRQARGLSPRTIQFYHEKSAPVCHLSLLPLTKSDLQQLLASLPCNPGGKRAYLRAWKTFYTWAEEEGRVGVNPCRGLRIKAPQSLRLVVGMGDLATIMPACQCERDRLIVAMLADTGLRLSELASMSPKSLFRTSSPANFVGLNLTRCDRIW